MSTPVLIDEQKLLTHLYQIGHFWNPSKPDLLNVQPSDIPNLTLTHPIAKQAIASWQSFDGNFDTLAFVTYLRGIIADGDVGPVTASMLEAPRCPLPDYAPPPGASFDYGDDALNSAVQRMQAATGSGSWPVGCHGTTGIHEVKVSYDTSKMSASQREWMPAAFAHNAEQVAAMGLKVIQVDPSEVSNVDIYGRSFGGSTIGMAEFNGESCRSNCFCTVSPGYDPNYRMFLILLMHEFGHTMNFDHSSRYIMNPSIMDVPEYWVQRDSTGKITYQDVRYAKGKQFFGGEPLTPPAPPPDPVPPAPGDHNGVFVYQGKVLKIKVFE